LEVGRGKKKKILARKESLGKNHSPKKIEKGDVFRLVRTFRRKGGNQKDCKKRARQIDQSKRGNEGKLILAVKVKDVKNPSVIDSRPTETKKGNVGLGVSHDKEIIRNCNVLKKGQGKWWEESRSL